MKKYTQTFRNILFLIILGISFSCTDDANDVTLPDLPIIRDSSTVLDDIKIKVASAEATSQEAGMEIDKTYDGDVKTFFNSKFGKITQWPFILDYHFENVESMDYIIYYPRQDAGNRWGAFGQFELWISTEDNPELKKYGEFDFKNNIQTPSRISFDTPVLKPKTIRFSVKSALESRVSCGEMEFYRTNPDNYDYLKIFADKSCSVLKPEITAKDIEAISNIFYKDIAMRIFNGTYDSEFRVQDYRPYQDPAIMSKINKTGKYSLRDNPTGIYAKEIGEEILVFVDDTKGQNLSLIIQDLNQGFGGAGTTTYPLQAGANKIVAKNTGLMYISNLTDDNIPLVLEKDTDKQKAKAKTVKVHIATGTVNGYFDVQKHTADDWRRILDNATYQDLDVLGKYTHITWTTADFRSYNTDIVTSLANYDNLVQSEHKLMGLIKYNKMFNNRMYFAIGYKAASPNATDYRTLYTPGYREIFCDVNRFSARLWGPAHEVGHVNQTRPGFKWTGMTEVTNNIFCLNLQQQLGIVTKFADKDYKLLKDATNGIIVPKNPHILPDNYGQHEWKLVPFWQLKLYLVDAKGQTDFFPDLFEHYRTTLDLDASKLTQGVLQLDFVRQVCNLSEINLLDFFDAWGFLRPLDVTVNDYGNKAFKITQEQVDALKAEIESKNYPKPTLKVEEIRDDNINLYK